MANLICLIHGHQEVKIEDYKVFCTFCGDFVDDVEDVGDLLKVSKKLTPNIRGRFITTWSRWEEVPPNDSKKTR